MDCSQKLIALAIDNFLKSYRLKNYKTLPVSYNTNRKACMTTIIWEKETWHLGRFCHHFLHAIYFLDCNNKIKFLYENYKL